MNVLTFRLESIFDLVSTLKSFIIIRSVRVESTSGYIIRITFQDRLISSRKPVSRIQDLTNGFNENICII